MEPEGNAMRNGELYSPEPQSKQLGLRGVDAKGEADAIEAEEWVAENSDAWDYMIRAALRLSGTGYISVRYLLNMVRNELHISVKNGLSPSFARMMVEQHPEFDTCIRRHKSQCDAYFGVDRDA